MLVLFLFCRSLNVEFRAETLFQFSRIGVCTQVDYTCQDYDKLLDDAVAAAEAPDSEPVVKVRASEPDQSAINVAAKKTAADSDFDPGSGSAKESSEEEWGPEDTVRPTRSSRRNVQAVGVSFPIATIFLFVDFIAFFVILIDFPDITEQVNYSEKAYERTLDEAFQQVCFMWIYFF